MTNEKIEKMKDFGGVCMPSHDWKSITPEKVKERLQNIKNIDEKDCLGFARLHYAARWTDESRVILAFKDKKPDMNVRDNYNRTPLHWAALGNDGIAWNEPHPEREIVKVLLDEGAKVDLEDNSGHTPIHLAAIRNRNEFVMQSLVDADGAEVNKADKCGRTPLALAEKYQRNDRVIKVLKEAIEKQTPKT